MPPSSPSFIINLYPFSAIEGTIIIREMETGIQETVLVAKIIDEMKKRLKR